MTYRQAEDIIKARKIDLDKAALAMVDALGAEPTETNVDQAKVLASAMAVFLERNQAANETWRTAGYLGAVLAIYNKATRLMNGLWYKLENCDKPIDNAIDAINYVVFFARCYEAGDATGAPRHGTYVSQAPSAKQYLNTLDADEIKQFEENQGKKCPWYRGESTDPQARCIKLPDHTDQHVNGWGDKWD